MRFCTNRPLLHGAGSSEDPGPAGGGLSPTRSLCPGASDTHTFSAHTLLGQRRGGRTGTTGPPGRGSGAQNKYKQRGRCGVSMRRKETRPFQCGDGPLADDEGRGAAGKGNGSLRRWEEEGGGGKFLSYLEDEQVSGRMESGSHIGRHGREGVGGATGRIADRPMLLRRLHRSPFPGGRRSRKGPRPRGPETCTPRAPAPRRHRAHSGASPRPRCPGLAAPPRAGSSADRVPRPCGHRARALPCGPEGQAR